MSELLTGVGVLHDGAEVALSVNWDRLIIYTAAIGFALYKIVPYVWPYIAPYIAPPIAAIADAVAQYRKPKV